MKFKLSGVIALLLALFMLCAMYPAEFRSYASSADFRAIWVATVLNLDYPTKSGLSADALKKEADTILNEARDLGYTAVILQVRPTSDSFYKSSIYPWSSYLTGTQGKAPASDFDPLQYWVEQAHARGLELHAWINPLRITQGSASAKQHDLSKLAATHPARLHPEWTVAHTDGKLYFDPGIPEVRKLIVDGVTEIVNNYAVDGIQYDDYFYPGSDFKDDASYKKYGGTAKRDDWRRENVNSLIRDTYNAVHSAKKGVVFGVSPFAIWCNKSTSSLGSDTKGSESYVTQYADTRKWVKNNWLDYIAPQIYWNIGFSIADYAVLVPWWNNVVDGTNVKLYIGTAIYRAGESDKKDSAWYGAEEIARQSELNKKYSQVSGVIHFRYKFLTTNKDLRSVVSRVFGSAVKSAASPSPSPSAALAEPAAAKLPVFSNKALAVGRPTSKAISTLESNYYILGACVPGEKLYVNGVEVADRSSDGFFGYYAKLSNGANKFTFTQKGQKNVEITITKKTNATTSPSKMNPIDIVAGTVFPKTENEYRKPGETVTLSCTAPIGASVKVTVGSKTYDMTPGTKTAPGSGAYPTTYTYTYTFPQTTETGKLVTLGTPKYSMTYGGKSYSRSAGGALISITPNAPFYATVKSASAFVFPNGTTTGGPSGELVKGQKDYVTAVAGNGAWVRLAVGAWIPAGDVTLKSETAALKADISSAVYAVGTAYDTLSLKVGAVSATAVAYDGKVLTLTVSASKAAPVPKLPSGSLFSGVTGNVKNGAAVYTLTLPNGAVLDGYYVSTTGDTITLNLKRHPKAVAGSKPLTGISILLDPGHGGTDTGAIGPLGAQLAEKHMNFCFALKLKSKLENKGATVTLTRSDDSLPSLNDRVEISRAQRPDLFFSLHTNSVAESTNSGNIKGVESFYRNPVGKAFSDLLMTTLKTDAAYGNRSSKQSNLYVIRPTWTPSVLVETGFICNPAEFSRLASDDAQHKLADLTVTAIVKYFS